MALNGRKRIVVVGLGSIGRRHARLLREREDVTVEVVEPSEAILKIAQDELGALKAHTSFESALETHPDIFWIATPTALHAKQTISALDNGFHVFCEKPMSDSLADARKMKKSADISGKIFSVGFMLHFMPAMVRLKQLIEGNILGNILHIHARVGTYITLVNSISRYQAHQPGSLFLDYAHQPDLFYWLLERIPKCATVTAFQSGDLEFSSDPNVADIVYQYDSPLLATLHLNYVQMPQRHDYEIIGDQGWAALDFETGEIKIGLREPQTMTTENYIYERDDLYRAQIKAFLDAVSDNRLPETSAADGLVSTAICDATIRSFQSNQTAAIKI